MLVPFVLALLSGILAGSWSVSLKKAEGHKFENFFLIFSVATLSSVLVITLIPEGAGIFGQIAASDPKSLAWGLGGGACWGIATLSFGYALTLVGLALSYAIILGLSMFLGTFVSMFFMSGIPPSVDSTVKIYVMLGVLVALIGAFLSSYAGHLRSKTTSAQGQRNFRKGILICGLSGFLASFFVWGYSGAHDQLSTWASIFLLVLGFSLAQLLVLGVKITRQMNWRAYKNLKPNILYPLLGGLVFGIGIVLHFASADRVGVSLAYPLMMGVQILIGNLWSFLVFREWREAPRNARALQVLALAVLVIASVSIGSAMGFVP